MILTQCVISVAFVLIAIVVTKSWKGSSDLLPLNFTLSVSNDFFFFLENSPGKCSVKEIKKGATGQDMERV